MNTFEERLYSSLDTIGDFFKDKQFLDAIERYKEKMMDAECNEMRYDNYSFGDVLREIFSSDENLSEFLGVLKEETITSLEDTTKKITFILCCEQVRRSIDNTPCSIKEIFSQRILSIMQFLGQETYPPEDGIDEGEIYWTYQNGLSMMEAMGFPVISEYGLPVYFYNTTENPEIIHVWSKETGIVQYNKSGEIITEQLQVSTEKKPKREIPSYLKAVEKIPS